MKGSPRGATLLELMIALTLQAIIFAVLYFAGPDLWRSVAQSKKSRAAKDAAALSYALWGPNEDYNGFVGDNGYLGTLPSDWVPYTPSSGGMAVSATYTWFKDNLALFQPPNKRYISVLGTTGGWNGPYVGLSYNHEGLRADPWGNSWKLEADGSVRSAGEDQLLNTGDDIVSNPGPIRPGSGGNLGTIFVRVFDPDGRPMGSTKDITGATTLGADTRLWVQVVNPTPGGAAAVGLVTATWDEATQYFTVGGLWPGRHAVQVKGLRGTVSALPVPNTTAICDGSPPAEGHLDTCTGLWGTSIAYIHGGGATTINIRLTQHAVDE